MVERKNDVHQSQNSHKKSPLPEQSEHFAEWKDKKLRWASDASICVRVNVETN